MASTFEARIGASSRRLPRSPGENHAHPHYLCVVRSRIRVSAGSVPADGTTPATITVMVRDGARDPIPGVQVAIGYSGTADIPAAVVTTGHDGSAVFRIIAAAATSGTVTATATNGPSVVLGTGTTLSFHGCANGHFFNGMCAPSPFVRLAPALPTSWGGAQPTAFAVGDLDEDGRPDVALLTDTGVFALLARAP